MARHAKCVTLKVEDIRLLRQLWKVIDPQSVIGEDTPENEKCKEVKRKLHARQIKAEKRKMQRKVTHLRSIGCLDKLSRGEMVFLREHKIAFL